MPALLLLVTAVILLLLSLFFWTRSKSPYGEILLLAVLALVSCGGFVKARTHSLETNVRNLAQRVEASCGPRAARIFRTEVDADARDSVARKSVFKVMNSPACEDPSTASR